MKSSLFLTVIIGNANHYRIFDTQYGFNGRTLNGIVVQVAAFGRNLGNRRRYAANNDEVAHMNKDFKVIPSFLQIAQLFPFFCDCAEAGNCLRTSP